MAAQVLVKFTEPVSGRDGKAYQAQACAGVGDDGLWEGWIEFEADDEVIRTGRETEQPNYADMQYWASGLTMVYLEGALERARAEPVTPLRQSVPATPAFEKPARRDAQPIREIRQRPVLNPFLVYAEGPDILRQQLGALSRDQLEAIVAGFNLPTELDLETASERDIAEEIVRIIREGRRPRRNDSERPANTRAHQSF